MTKRSRAGAVTAEQPGLLGPELLVGEDALLVQGREALQALQPRVLLVRRRHRGWVPAPEPPPPPGRRTFGRRSFEGGPPRVGPLEAAAAPIAAAPEAAA